MVAADGPSSTYTQEMAKYKAQNPGLTVSDIQVYNINRTSYFSGTIAVCVIYGVFCLLLLLLTVFSPTGSRLVTETFRTFTITFIIGMIIAVIMLTIAVVSYKPTQLSQNPYDPQMCPDNWKFIQTAEDDNTYKAASSENKMLMEYQCVSKTDKRDPISPTSKYKKDSTDPIDIQALYTYTKNDTSVYGSKSKLDCTKVFPLLLNSVNRTNPEINNIPNALACDYAQECGISWTNMCPAGPTTIA